MQWNLRMAAAQRGVWRASDLRGLLGAAGLEISAGKMSYLWSGRPISIRLDDLEVICSVLDCQPGELLVRDEPKTPKAVPAERAEASKSSTVRPRPRRGGRPLPPA